MQLLQFEQSRMCVPATRACIQARGMWSVQELQVNLAENIGADPPLPVADAITLVADRKKEWQLPDTELIKVRCSGRENGPCPGPQGLYVTLQMPVPLLSLSKCSAGVRS